MQQKRRGHQDWGQRDHRGGWGVAMILAQSYVGLNLVAGGGGRGANCGERLGDKMEEAQ